MNQEILHNITGNSLPFDLSENELLGVNVIGTYYVKKVDTDYFTEESVYEVSLCNVSLRLLGQPGYTYVDRKSVV